MTSQGPVLLLANAQVSLSAPFHRIGAGFRVNFGGCLQIMTGPVSCVAAASQPLMAEGGPAPTVNPYTYSAPAAPTPVMPLALTAMDRLPDEVRDLLLDRGIDVSASD
jgi:hypothetical protein